VNRFLRGLHDVDAVAVLAKQRLSMSRQSAFSVHAFTADESSAIEKIAQDTAGYLMVMPYLMAVTMQSFYAVYAGEGTAIVSLNADTRGRNAKPETLFFNRLSFYHLRAARETTHDLKRLCADLRLQWYDQTKNGIPAKIASASLLTRILPLSLMRMGVESGLAKNPVSFAFSYIGPSTSSGTESMSTAFGADVTDLRHMPIVPYHPGIGVFFTKWNGVLHLVLSYCPAQVIPAVAERFAAVIVDTLKGAI